MGSAKYPMRKNIRIQRLQTKNRMVGQTFNPSGITSQQIDSRERAFVNEWKQKTLEERKQYWDNVQQILEERERKNLHYSWNWEWCAFQRAFVFRDEVL